MEDKTTYEARMTAQLAKRGISESQAGELFAYQRRARGRSLVWGDTSLLETLLEKMEAQKIAGSEAYAFLKEEIDSSLQQMYVEQNLSDAARGAI